jgi:hypothetical protein
VNRPGPLLQEAAFFCGFPQLFGSESIGISRLLFHVPMPEIWQIACQNAALEPTDSVHGHLGAAPHTGESFVGVEVSQPSRHLRHETRKRCVIRRM